MFLFVIVGNLAEIPSLEASLVKKDDAKVSLASIHWRWSEKEPYPPLSAVLKTPIWALDRYNPVRCRLLNPIPAPEIRLGGQYLTVDLHPPTKASVEPQPSAPVDTPEPTSSEASAVPSRGSRPKRAAAPVGRYGLVHVAGFHYQAPLPADLSNINYSAVIVEAGENNFSEGVHPHLVRLVSRGVPTLIVGKHTEVRELTQFLKDSIADHRTYEVEICRPPTAGGAGSYRFTRTKMVIVVRTALTWKVCSVLPVVK